MADLAKSVPGLNTISIDANFLTMAFLIIVSAEAKLDGGDVLFTGREILVGLSVRTNERGVKAIQEAFPGFTVTPIQVSGPLHLKTLLTLVGPDTLCASTETGDSVAMLDVSTLSLIHLVGQGFFFRKHPSLGLVFPSADRQGQQVPVQEGPGAERPLGQRHLHQRDPHLQVGEGGPGIVPHPETAAGPELQDPGGGAERDGKGRRFADLHVPAFQGPVFHQVGRTDEARL